MGYGNGLLRTFWSMNERLQPTAYWDAFHDDPNQFVRLEYPNWVDQNGNNNGNLQSSKIYAGGPAAQDKLAQFNDTFGYDQLNRLSTSSDTGGWTRSFVYDRWGNMAVAPGSTGPQLNINTPVTADATTVVRRRQ